MSKVKLTLTVDESVVLRAKEQALKKKTSLSKIVETYLAEISPPLQYGQTSDAWLLRGIAKRSGLSSKTDKEIRAMMYKDRYGI